jgi:glucosamine kinase
MSGTRPAVLVADIGKTQCRVQLVEPNGAVRWAASGEGLPGLAASGADTVAQHLVALIASSVHAGIGAVSVGVAGAIAAPEAAGALAERLVQAFDSRAVVTSDIVTAHLGALDGGAGTALVAGTGAVAMGIADDGRATVVDGHGPDVGDLGGGAWIGRTGLAAALRATDGAAPSTGLHAALTRLLAPHQDLQLWLAVAENLGGRLGAFAPAVLDLAEHGDATADDIVREAVRLLTATAVAAGETRVTALGGLVGHAGFRSRLIASLRAAGLDPVRPIGNALDGARLAAIADQLPHERHFHRAE